MADNSSVYLTPEDVAERLKLGVDTIYRWLRTKKLPGTRLSRKAWRISEDDLRVFMEGMKGQ